ncbi:ATP12 family protein [Novosphingobium sp. PASSN1]|uniref:ATP12 family chaperone protein n=1 Tax=Novosphingobium sp. PASSN1 TaxID=2015561 RepID=UPI000BC827DB|nr:ATP12 family protein [Novosphingobium sp. PASSN1]OYU34183.1 MAG: ATPase [Novosphingobium sp. PASSN1]
MKRFYTAAAVAGTAAPIGITLDGRPLRTPGRLALDLPTRTLAEAIAGEWNAQTDSIDPRTMPLTGLANAAVERVAADPDSFATGLARYAESELLAYRADYPPALVARQQAEWDPWLAWARSRYDVDFTLVTGIMHQPQPPATLARITAAYRALDAFRLAALNPIVTITGSAILGLALAEGALDAATAWTVSHLDELWQAEQWGKDPLAEAGHAERQRDLATAATFLQLL